MTERGCRRGHSNASRGVSLFSAGLLAVAVALMLPSAALAIAPDPGGDPDAELSGPPPGKLYGFSGVSQVLAPNPTEAATLVSAINGNAARVALHWQALEPVRDVYSPLNFPEYDQLYAALVARGITPIMVLQFAPQWAREPGAPQNCGHWDRCHYPPAPEMYGEWREFVADIARRYPKAALEIWNEPNYVNQWQSGVDPAGYAELLAQADNAAASVDPSMSVFSGGLGAGTQQDSLSAGQFLRAAYAARPSLRGHTDALNFHVYPWLNFGPGSVMAEAFAEVRGARDAAGDHSTPLLVTEIGGTTTGPDPLTEAQQAELLMGATRRILTMPDTLGVLVYTLADRISLDSTDPERGYGAMAFKPGLSGLLTPKQSYCALLAAAEHGGYGCPPPPSPPPRGTEPADLELSVKGPRRLIAGGRARVLRVRVAAGKEGAALADVSICLRTRSPLFRAAGEACRRLQELAPGARERVGYRVKLRRRARDRQVTLRFEARATDRRAVARIRLCGR